MWQLKILLVLLSAIHLVASDPESPTKPADGLIIFAVIFLVLVLLGGFAAFLYIRRNQLNNAGLKGFLRIGNINNINPNETLDKQMGSLPYDKTFEISQKKLKLRSQLGVGTFGTIYKASAEGIQIDGENTIVAAKVVKKHDDDNIKRVFANELKIMANLGRHLNIVNLLGAITKRVTKHELTAIVEYCPFGNLQSFLVRHRRYFINQILLDQDMIDPTITATHQVKSHSPYQTIDSHNSNFDPFLNGANYAGSQSDMLSINSTDYPTAQRRILRTVTTTDLLCWAFQISRGLQYLTSRNVIAGNLAARNILLCDNNVVKITDFGLERTVYKCNVYLEKRQDPMPFKWFAPECINSLHFTSSSDVWSFGIVCWELFTLGAPPYPGVDDYLELHRKINQGFRLEKPQLATHNIYHDIIFPCWRLKPELRSSISDIEDEIYKILERNIANKFITENDQYMLWNRTHFSPDQTDYLKIIRNPNIATPKSKPKQVSPVDVEERKRLPSSSSIPTIQFTISSTSLNEQKGPNAYVSMTPVTPPTPNFTHSSDSKSLTKQTSETSQTSQTNYLPMLPVPSESTTPTPNLKLSLSSKSLNKQPSQTDYLTMTPVTSEMTRSATNLRFSPSSPSMNRQMSNDGYLSMQPMASESNINGGKQPNAYVPCFQANLTTHITNFKEKHAKN